MRILGHSLLWFGFLAAVIVALRDGRNVDITMYVVFLVVGIVGVVLLRATAKAAATQAHSVSADIEVMKNSLLSLNQKLDALLADKDQTDVYDVHGMIDERLVRDLNAFADARESMIPMFGMDAYAEVMSRFAASERLINRSWSASADGYIDEVWKSLDQARQLMADANARFEGLKRA